MLNDSEMERKMMLHELSNNTFDKNLENLKFAVMWTIIAYYSAIVGTGELRIIITFISALSAAVFYIKWFMERPEGAE